MKLETQTMKNTFLTTTLSTALLLGVYGASIAAAQDPIAAASVQVGSSYAQRLASARTSYFKELQGGHDARDPARQQFDSLAAERPGDAVVQAYLGSLDLLDAAHSVAFWKIHTLSQQGLRELDRAVDRDPANLEARFIRAATTWHLPFFFHRRDQAESDFAYIAPRAAAAVAKGTLPPQLAAAALDYYGQVLSDKSDRTAAKNAYEAAVRIDQSSPAGQDASRRLKQAD